MKKAIYPRLVLWALALFLLSGCSLFRSEAETPAPPIATIRPTAIGTPPGTSPADAGTPVSTPTPEGPLTLVLWASEDYAPNSETDGGMQLLEQIQAFKQSYDVEVEVILKKHSGTGGLLDFLSTASVAAPSVLPDLITLSDADLYRAAQAGLLQPLDELVSPELLDDQFDFALALTQLGGTTMGVLYQADLHHLVYDTMAVEEPPLSWTELYSSTVPFVFSPAAPADGVNDVILIQYLALGGQLTDEGGQPSIDVERLTQALEFFQTAQQVGVIPRSVLGLSDATTAWATFRIGEAGMVQIPASLYLAERAGLSSAGFAPVPLSEPGSSTVGHGWALAVVTQDPGRQQLAAALIEYLLEPENSGAWTQAAGKLPTRYGAFDFWDQDDVYLPFVRELLAQAEPEPNPQLASVVGGPLAQALAEALSGQATPAEAAQSAAEAVEAPQ
jgi:ABC-type glycerol-3-phosphate transport system substrate-binding protein